MTEAYATLMHFDFEITAPDNRRGQTWTFHYDGKSTLVLCAYRAWSRPHLSSQLRSVEDFWSHSDSVNSKISLWQVPFSEDLVAQVKASFLDGALGSLNVLVPMDGSHAAPAA